MYKILFVNNAGDTVEQGDVVVVGKSQTTSTHEFDKNIVMPEVDLAEGAYDTRVCGVVCELQAHVKLEPSQELDVDAQVKKPTKVAKREAADNTAKLQTFTLQEMEKMDHTKIDVGKIGQMIILGAFAHCKVDADIAPIKVGDLLTTSPTKGHAQKVLDPSEAVGAILGKALGNLRKGKGKIPVLVTLQ